MTALNVLGGGGVDGVAEKRGGSRVFGEGSSTSKQRRRGGGVEGEGVPWSSSWSSKTILKGCSSRP